MRQLMRIAALYVETDGCYANAAGVDPWDIVRDARQYDGPWPVVAHPPCQRWGRFWHGSTRKPHQFKLGDDDGCFAAALAVVRIWMQRFKCFTSWCRPERRCSICQGKWEPIFKRSAHRRRNS